MINIGRTVAVGQRGAGSDDEVESDAEWPIEVAKRLEQVDPSIARSLAALDRADREGSDVPEARTQRISEEIAVLCLSMACLREMQERFAASDDGLVSLTDPDARSMATSWRGTSIVGDNVQIAVDP